MRKLLFILLTFFSSFAFAQSYYWTFDGASGTYTSAGDACTAAIAASPNYVLTGIEYQTDTRFSCIAYHGLYGSPPGSAYRTVFRYGSFCDPGSVYDPVKGACAPPAGPACSPGVKKWYSWSGAGAKTEVCSSGCKATSTGMQVNASTGSAGEFTSSGASCTGGDTGAPDPGTCPAGTHNISSDAKTVNCTADKPEPPKCWVGSTNVSTDPEIAVCVADSTPKTGPDDPASHTPDPNKTPSTKTTTVTEPMADGGVKNTSTTTTTTTNTDGSTSVTSKTTTTITSPTGETKTTTDTNKPKDPTKSFCELNPTLTICRNSVVTGDCDSLSIEGDAIQGAILRQQKKEYCDNLAASQIKDLGLAMIANNDPMKSQFPTAQNAEEIDLSNIGSLDSSGFLGGGSCFNDKTFNISGIAVRIPISVVCDYLTPLRLAIMLLALMASYKMISGTILRDL